MRGNTKNERLTRTVKKNLWHDIMSHWQLYVLILPTIIYLFIFNYIPMYGVLMAFQNFKPNKGILGSEWVGLEHFIRFFKSPGFLPYLKNTLRLSLYGLISGFPLPIILAVCLNYMWHPKLKKFIQTVTYAPHFISTVVLCGMILIFLSPRSGVINLPIKAITGKSFFFMGSARAFPHIYNWSGVWQGLGWSSILYMAAIAGVDPSLHESAIIDGATKIKRVIHIDLPAIMPTIIISLILCAGGLLSVGFEKVYLLQNQLNIETSEVISTYVYKQGLVGGQFSYSAAVGLTNAVVNVIILTIVNFIAGRLGETKLW